MTSSPFHNTILLGASLCLIILSACNQKQESPTFQTEVYVDSINKLHGKVNCKVKLTIDFPTKWNETPANAVQDWMANLLKSTDSIQMSDIKT